MGNGKETKIENASIQGVRIMQIANKCKLFTSNLSDMCRQFSSKLIIRNTVYSNSNAQCYALSFMTLIYDSYSQLSILSMSTVHTCVSSHIGLKNRPFYKWALFSHTQSKTTFDIVYSTLFQFSSCACSV